MSEAAATFGLPLVHEITHHASHHAHAHSAVPAELFFAFRSTRWRTGLVLGAGGTALLAVGLFLLSQISETPALTAQLAILGSLGVVGGLAFLTKSVRDLLGRLVINDDGISVRPGFAGFSVPWSELTRWEVKAESDRHPEDPSVRFWIQGTLCPVFIPNGWLSDDARQQLRQELRSRVPSMSIAAE